jgi:NAD+ diphosphatase
MDDVYCFGGNPLDRSSERRDDGEWIAKLLGDPETRLLALRDLKPFTRGTTVPTLDWQPVAQWRDQVDAGAPLIFLGLGDGRAHFAIDMAGADVPPDVDAGLIDVRALAPTLAPGEAAILAEARSLLDWHARHRFCAQCGSPIRVASAGWKRHCPGTSAGDGRVASIACDRLSDGAARPAGRPRLLACLFPSQERGLEEQPAASVGRAVG